jgi:hypothetical protein
MMALVQRYTHTAFQDLISHHIFSVPYLVLSKVITFALCGLADSLNPHCAARLQATIPQNKSSCAPTILNIARMPRIHP